MIGVGRLTALLVRYRVRSGVNALRARPSGPFALLLAFGLASAVAYVGLFATALDAMAVRGGGTAQIAALELMAGAIALASLAARASGEGLFVGTPENEFLLTRPISLARLVAARCLAALLTDPFGALFLLPVLLAAALVWRLPPGACGVAVVTSSLAQLTISALAQAVQVGVVRWIPRRRRTTVFVLLRLGSALTMAAVWVAATAVLRTPDALGRHLAQLQRGLALTPAGPLVAPIVAYRRGGAGAVALALGPLAAAAAGSLGVTLAIARRAGMRGWEEAGAPWAETATMAAPGPPLTLVRREWRLLARDRPRLAALVALPVLLLCVQGLGTIGWAAGTATSARIAVLTFSVTVYLAALGPLGHMQHERRAFWILRAAPISVGRIMRAKALAWIAIVGGAALALYAALAVSLRGRSPAELVATGVLVVGAAITTTILAVGLGCAVADLTDDQRPALGPGSVYLFLLLGGLMNVVFWAAGWELFRASVLYLGLVAALWRTGMARVETCLDAEAHRSPGLQLGDAAIVLVVIAVVPIALNRGLVHADVGARAIAASRVGVILLMGLVAAALLRRRRKRARQGQGERMIARTRTTVTITSAIGLAAGLGTLFLRQLLFGPGPALDAAFWRPATFFLLLSIAVAEELVFRGVVQGALEQEAEAWIGLSHGRWLAVPAGIALALLATPNPTGMSVLLALGPSVARAASGRVLAAGAARLVILVGG